MTHDAGGRSRPAGDESAPLDADRMDLALAKEALAEEELGDNDLAEATLAIVDRVRPYFSTILAGLAAALAAFLAYGVVQSQAEATRTQSWDACLAAMSAGDADSFNEVMRRYPGSDAARWAQLLTADAAAAQGSELLFIDRQRAEGRLQAAVEAYSSLLAGRPQGLLGERVVFGLAKARESLGQLAEARRGFEAVAAEFPAEALGQVASARAAELGRESTRQWYDWFGAQKIAPPASATNANPATAAPVTEPVAPTATEPTQPAAGQ
jgi:DNA-binding FadR family transcriptional regulator